MSLNEWIKINLLHVTRFFHVSDTVKNVVNDVFSPFGIATTSSF